MGSTLITNINPFLLCTYIAEIHSVAFILLAGVRFESTCYDGRYLTYIPAPDDK
jgi:hypothetical protein